MADAGAIPPSSLSKSSGKTNQRRRSPSSVRLKAYNSPLRFGLVNSISAASLGLTLTVFIAVKTNQHNEDWAQQFKSVIENIPGVLEVYRMGGDVDYLIKALVKGMPGYDALYKELIKADLFEVSASFVMEELKQTTVLPL